jgi:GTPase
MIKIAIVGRPNVGKSALFNRICGKRIAIVDDAEGVTRDRLYAGAECFGRPFQVIDTGGIDAQSKIPFQEGVRRQAEIAMEEADSIIMVVDGVIGPTLLDEEVARILRRKGKPVCLAVNKIDDFGRLDLVHQFHSLGINPIVPVSATQGFQIAELLESALSDVPPAQEEEASDRIKVAIVGRPNVGKSTLMNYLLQEERCVVSPIAGTTRDSIDVPLGDDFLLIDTAGIRRKKAEHDVVDKFAAIRTERAISRADVCILVMDAKEGITVQEKRIADQIEKEGKGCLLLFNKWDLVKGFRMEHCLQGVHQEAPFLKHCPALFASAQTGRNLKTILSQVKEIHTQLHRRITTGQLNKFLEKALQKYHPPMIGGKRLRIYYVAQIDVAPPRFIMFVNYPELMLDTYHKYLVHQFREIYQFTGAPLVFSLKGKRVKEDKPAAAAEEVDPHHTTENIWVEEEGEEEWIEGMEDETKELILHQDELS